MSGKIKIKCNSIYNFLKGKWPKIPLYFQKLANFTLSQTFGLKIPPPSLNFSFIPLYGWKFPNWMKLLISWKKNPVDHNPTRPDPNSNKKSSKQILKNLRFSQNFTATRALLPQLLRSILLFFPNRERREGCWRFQLQNSSSIDDFLSLENVAKQLLFAKEVYLWFGCQKSHFKHSI